MQIGQGFVIVIANWIRGDEEDVVRASVGGIGAQYAPFGLRWSLQVRECLAVSGSKSSQFIYFLDYHS